MCVSGGKKCQFFGKLCARNKWMFSCRTYAYQERDTAEECPEKELKSQFLEVVDKFLYFDKTVGCSWQCFSKSKKWVE